MKIVVNARWLSKPCTGIGQYTKNMMRELARIDAENEYVLLVPEEIKCDFPENVRVEVLEERRMGNAGMRKTWWEQIQVPDFMKKEKADLAFFTYPANPWTRDFDVRSVVVVHDCIPWMDKEYNKRLLSRAYNGQTRKAVKLADKVVTVSKDAAADIKKMCGVEAEVIYNDADPVYKKKAVNLRALDKFELRAGEYFLYVGGYDPRKNVQFLLEEFVDFGMKKLVLVGGKTSDNCESFDFADRENVVKTGFLSEEELAGLYAGCLAFVNLSRKEGFNLPIVEAANCGAALMLSDIAVHREVAGDAAMFVKLEESETVEGFKKMLKEQGDWADKSAKIAERYSWEKSAKKLKDVLFS